MLSEETRICEQALESMRDAELRICKTIAGPLRDESRHLERFAEGENFDGNEGLKRALTLHPFNILHNAMGYLSHVFSFRDDAIQLQTAVKEELARPTEQRKPERILTLIDSIQSDLEKRIGYSVSEAQRPKPSNEL